MPTPPLVPRWPPRPFPDAGGRVPPLAASVPRRDAPLRRDAGGRGDGGVRGGNRRRSRRATPPTHRPSGAARRPGGARTAAHRAARPPGASRHSLGEERTMREYGSREIRNVAVVGHGASGKTSLVDAMVFAAGASKRHGAVKDGTALTDFTPEETERGFSITLGSAYAEWQGCK